MMNLRSEIWVQFLLLMLVNPAFGYTIYSASDPSVCNRTIYLGLASGPGAILRLSSEDVYETASLYCVISFTAPIHNWSGLTGILEHVDLRKFEEGHRLGESFCVDYIKVLTENSNSVPNKRQCGSWTVGAGQALSRIGFSKGLVGYCPHSRTPDATHNCHEVTELKVVVSIGRERESLWRNMSWRPHTGFTFVVTPYSYPIKNGGSECRDGLVPCRRAHSWDSGPFHCVHESLWCDGHVNCGLVQSMDELACFRGESWYQAMTMLAPWSGVMMFCVIAVCGVYRCVFKLRREAQALGGPLEPPDMASYAESYERGSASRSSHQMAIQVNVVCNSGQSSQGARIINPIVNDLPPTYKSLFPQGPPSIFVPVTSVAATVAQDISGTTRSTLGLNISSALPYEPAISTAETGHSKPRDKNSGTSAMLLSDISNNVSLTFNSNYQSSSNYNPSDSVETPLSLVLPDANLDRNVRTNVILELTPTSLPMNNSGNNDHQHYSSSHISNTSNNYEESGSDAKNELKSDHGASCSRKLEANISLLDSEQASSLQEKERKSSLAEEDQNND